MKRIRGLSVDWYPAGNAQLEIIAPKPPKKKNSNYEVKYTPPYRATMRPPPNECLVGPPELLHIAQRLDLFATHLDSRAIRPGSVRSSLGRVPSSLEEMKMVGNQLLENLIPDAVQRDLRNPEVFLEIGTDEALQDYPWELMHDGEDFLCMKHYMGRYVNATEKDIYKMTPPKDWVGSKINELSVLVISVPEPNSRDGSAEFKPLRGAEAETKAIVKTLNKLENRGIKYDLLEGADATYDKVFRALKANQYHIIHFSGHASSKSGLALYNQDLKAGEVANYFRRAQPVFCFMNACETGRTGNPRHPLSRAWEAHHNIFRLAKAFLLTGTYLLGSRWELGDIAAARFAAKFYSTLLGNEKSIGQSITEARKDCMNASRKDQLSWASYIFYGDPRLYFRHAH